MISISKYSPRHIGIFSAVSASLAGLVYLALAGAPMQMLGINLAALLIGLVLLPSASLLYSQHRFAIPIMMSMAILMLVTALAGETVEGASRWTMVGPIFIQPSLILLPPLILLFTRERNNLAALAMVIAAVSMALQPDRAMAGVMLAAMIALATVRFDRFVFVALLASAAAFSVTLVLADNLPAVPFVDQIYYTAFDVNLIAGMAVIVGSTLLLLPSLAAIWFKGEDQAVCLVFGTIWLAIILAAALGNYPTPVVGYSGAAIIGYVLSLSILPRKASVRQANTTEIDKGEVQSAESDSLDKLVWAPN